MIFKFFFNLRTGSLNWLIIADGSLCWGTFKIDTKLANKFVEQVGYRRHSSETYRF